MAGIRMLVLALAMGLPILSPGQDASSAMAPAQAPAGSPPLPKGTAPLPAERSGTPWWQNLRLSGSLGASWAYGTTYANLGVSAGYVVVVGLTPTLGMGFWLGSPGIVTVQPELDWYIPLPGGVQPYIGAYWAHWFVSGSDQDRNAYGFRGGLSLARLGPVFPVRASRRPGETLSTALALFLPSHP